MRINIKDFFAVDKATKKSFLKEDDNTGMILPTGGEADDDEMYGDEEDTDDWNKPEPDDSAEFEKEPTARDVKKNEPPAGDYFKKKFELKALEDKKDALLMQLKSNIISLDQYKSAIGNIPNQIKKLRADLEAASNVSAGDDEEL